MPSWSFPVNNESPMLWAAVVYTQRRSDLTPVTFLWASGGLSAGDGGPLAHRYFEPRVTRVTLPQVSLFRRGALEGESEYQPLSLELANDDGLFDDFLEDYLVRGSRVEVWVLWRGAGFHQAERRMLGVVDSLESDLDKATLVVQEPTERETRKIQEPGDFYFWGLGHALQHDGSTATPLVIPDAPSLRGPYLDQEVAAELAALPAATKVFEILYKSGSPTPSNYSHILRVLDDGSLSFYTSNPPDLLASAPGLVAAGGKYRFRIVASPDGKAIWLDGLKVASNAVAYAPGATPAGPLYVGSGYDGTKAWNGRLFEVRAWSEIRGDAAYRELMHRPPDPAPYPENLAAYFPLNEGTLLVAYDESQHGLDAAVSASVTWTTSGTGDRELAGKGMPLALGEAYWCKPVQTSVTFLEWRFHLRGIKELYRLFSGAVPLWPLYSSSAPLTFTAAGGVYKITSTDPTGLRPFVKGQQVAVTGTVSNNATFTVKSEGDQALVVVEAVTPEVAGSPLIRTPAGLDAYSVDLARATVRLTSPPSGELRAHLKGDVNAAGVYVYTAADIAKRIYYDFLKLSPFVLISGDSLVLVQPVNSDDVDALNGINSAVVGWYSDGEATGAAVLDFILGSIGAWRIPDSAGVIRLGRLDVPTPSTVSGDPLDNAVLARNGLKQLAGEDRAWSYGILFRKVWHPMTVSDCSQNARANYPELVREVSDKHGGQVADKRDEGIRSEEGHSLQDDTTPYPTGLVNSADAAAEALRKFRMHSVRRRSYSAATEGFVALPGEVRRLYHDRVEGGRGVPVVVIGKRPGPTPGACDYEVWGGGLEGLAVEEGNVLLVGTDEVLLVER